MSLEPSSLIQSFFGLKLPVKLVIYLFALHQTNFSFETTPIRALKFQFLIFPFLRNTENFMNCSQMLFVRMPQSSHLDV